MRLLGQDLHAALGELELSELQRQRKGNAGPLYCQGLFDAITVGEILIQLPHLPHLQLFWLLKGRRSRLFYNRLLLCLQTRTRRCLCSALACTGRCPLRGQWGVPCPSSSAGPASPQPSRRLPSPRWTSNGTFSKVLLPPPLFSEEPCWEDPLTLSSPSSGRRMWRYAGQVLDPGFPRRVSDLGLPRHPDSAFYYSPLGHLVVFKGSRYYVLNLGTMMGERYYPRRLGDWTGVPRVTNGALARPDGRLFFFRERRFWRFDPVKVRVTREGQWAQELGWTGCTGAE